MSRPMASSRVLLRVMETIRARPATQCRRLVSSTSSSVRRPGMRPTIPRCAQQAKQHQPLVQKRFRHKTVEQAKSEYQLGPFSWKAGVLFFLTAGALTWYFEHEKERIRKKRIADGNKAVGTPHVGGPFELVDQNGKKVTEEDLKGRFSLIYFGFTHCPDICPEELDKMALMYDLVNKQHPGALRGVFVTCDPERDGPAEVKEYLAEFHPDFVGLTGTYEQVKAVCKAYRVYFSTPANVRPGQDYLVDHSIYFYLMDPEGNFVEALGRQDSPESGAKLIGGHVRNWKGGFKKE